MSVHSIKVLQFQHRFLQKKHRRSEMVKIAKKSASLSILVINYIVLLVIKWHHSDGKTIEHLS